MSKCDEDAVDAASTLILSAICVFKFHSKNKYFLRNYYFKLMMPVIKIFDAMIF